MIAIFNLLSNIIMTGTSIIGCATIVNKVGKFCKIIEDSNSDGFKMAFDGLMMDTIDDMNKCVESVSAIANNVNSVLFIMYDILTGNKFIKKNKEGKIIICNKSKIYSGYKDKIDELSTKVKQYQEELKKMKKNKEMTKNNDKNDDDSSLDSSVMNDNSSLPDDEEDDNTISSNDTDETDDNTNNNNKSNNKNKKDEFFLE